MAQSRVLCVGNGMWPWPIGIWAKTGILHCNTISTTREPRQWQQLFCPHCGEKVSQRTTTIVRNTMMCIWVS